MKKANSCQIVLSLVMVLGSPFPAEAQAPETGEDVGAKEAFGLPVNGSFWGTGFCSFGSDDTSVSVDLFTVPSGSSARINALALSLIYNANSTNDRVNILVNVDETVVSGGQVNQIAPWYFSSRSTLPLSSEQTLTVRCFREAATATEFVRISVAGVVRP